MAGGGKGRLFIVIWNLFTDSCLFLKRFSISCDYSWRNTSRWWTDWNNNWQRNCSKLCTDGFQREILCVICSRRSENIQRGDQVQRRAHQTSVFFSLKSLFMLFFWCDLLSVFSVNKLLFNLCLGGGLLLLIQGWHGQGICLGHVNKCVIVALITWLESNQLCWQNTLNLEVNFRALNLPWRIPESQCYSCTGHKRLRLPCVCFIPKPSFSPR